MRESEFHRQYVWRKVLVEKAKAKCENCRLPDGPQFGEVSCGLCIDFLRLSSVFTKGWVLYCRALPALKTSTMAEKEHCEHYHQF